MSTIASGVGRSIVSGISRLPLAAKIGLTVVALIVLAGILSPLLLIHNPTAVGLAAPTQGPSGTYPFGIDRLGRDVFSRLVAGTPRSLIVGFGSAGLALVVGAALGAVAGTSGRVVDEIIMRLLDVVMAFPTIVLAALLVVAFGTGNLVVLVMAIAFVFMPQMARIVRANVISQYGEDYVAAEKVIGARRGHILIRHVARNCAAPILVFVTIMVANAIVFEASLSFIGAGLQGQDGPSSWGSVISYGQQLLSVHGWWATFFPGLLILVTVLSLNLLAEGISDVFAAPAARRGLAQSTAAAIDEADGMPEGAGTLTALPGLAEAAARFATGARTIPAGPPILQVTDLRIGFPGRHRGVDIVDKVSFDLKAGEVLGLVGESGCGKSLTAVTLMGLQPKNARVGGSIRFEGVDLTTLSAQRRRALMGREIAMIYQDSLSALNPAMTVEAQLKQLLKRGGKRSATELLTLVGLDAQRTLRAYPHELSGGQRQRVVIAMALSRDPKLIIADEPTTALDVTVQAQVINLLLKLREELDFALIFVSHDLALVADLCDRIVVMYGGQVAETGTVTSLLASPEHHYTRGLLASVLSLETNDARLSQIRGVVPSPADFPAGCRFADRCPMATQICHVEQPVLAQDADQHATACHHPASSTARNLVRS
ncbi:ABC transporter [Frondihabitans sp. PAMC 28766]|uniref:dipeptide/oligopeptide/nickel ABC transporter permease/ATP-binding protein n=1 Tax=Frondihabitans sp. PAMC 28766 TaxID=1795630 RepID=UPI00078C9212|nr:dipeptide/oligopeptide/nickel ABC transporter permease/ATP-binding protein [Frondihabitans sp. PAMC 28766]AMM20187.1 ABC transporter [Frondihabitans sp. PAMC 28766]